MKTINRYVVENLVEMPDGAKVLSVGDHGGLLVAWAIVDTDQPMRAYKFLAIDTLWGAGEVADMAFVGTVQAGNLVWHVFAEPDCVR